MAEVRNSQNIFTLTLQEFGTLENLFSDVIVPNSLNLDKELKQNETININTIGKGNKTVKDKIQELGLIMTNGEVEAAPPAPTGIGYMIIESTFIIG